MVDGILSTLWHETLAKVKTVAVLHQAKATQWNTSATRTSYRHCSQAEKHLIQQMMALIDSAWGPSSHYDSKQHEDILARLQSPTLSHTQFQSQLATSLIWTHSGGDPRFALPQGGWNAPQPSCRLGMYASILICGEYCFLMNTARRCPAEI